MRVWTLAVVALLAGCAGDGKTAEEPDAFRDLDTSSDKGLIRGVVVDQSIQPVAGARIDLRPAGLEATTDADGAFAFTDLEPGVYFVTASAPYYSTVQTSADVQAGIQKPPVVRIAIEALPKPVPAIQEFQYRFVTSASAWVTSVGGVVVSDLVGEGHFSTAFDLAANTTWVQGELVWSPQQPLAASMRLDSQLEAEGGSANQVVAGPSPLLLVFDQETVPGPDEMSMQARIFIHNGELPAGLAVNQDAEFIVHAFQHFAPDEGWRFTSDGAHAVPPPP